MRVQSGYDLQSSQKFVKSNLHTKIRCSLSVNGLRRFLFGYFKAVSEIAIADYHIRILFRELFLNV